MKLYTLLLLDFDGVLSDSLAVCMQEINRLVETKFPAIPRVRWQQDMARVYNVQLRHSLYPFGLDDCQTRSFFKDHSCAMNRRATDVEPFYQVVQSLNACTIPKVIVTSSNSEAVHTVLRKCQSFRNESIQAIYGRELRKTKTENIHHALRTFSENLSNALYIGDLVSDLLYCRDVPVDVAVVGYSYHPSGYSRRFSPDYDLESPADVMSFLAQLDHSLNSKAGGNHEPNCTHLDGLH